MPYPYYETILSALKESGRSARDVSKAAVGHESAIRGLKRGLDLRGSTLENLCRELNLEFYIGPPRKDLKVTHFSDKRADLAPVKDRELAGILTIIADEWEALNAHGRKQLLARFQAAFPELRGGGAPLSRIVGFLGWKVIDTASARGAEK